MHAKAKFRTGREYQRADAVACQAELWASQDMQGTEAVLRLVLATLRSCAKASGRSAERTSMAVEAHAGYSAELREASWQRARQTKAWLLVSGVHVQSTTPFVR